MNDSKNYMPTKILSNEEGGTLQGALKRLGRGADSGIGASLSSEECLCLLNLIVDLSMFRDLYHARKEKEKKT